MHGKFLKGSEISKMHLNIEEPVLVLRGSVGLQKDALGKISLTL